MAQFSYTAHKDSVVRRLCFIGKNRAAELSKVELDPDITGSRQLDLHVAITFADWVNGGPEPETSGRNNLPVLATLNAVIESGTSGRAVRVEI